MEPAVNLIKIKENLETQVSELETLESMFCNPGEVRVEDVAVLADIRDFLNDKTTTPPSYLDITINLQVDNQKFELCVNLSHEYPELEPDIFVRNHKLNKKQHANLNKDLSDYISTNNIGEPCIFSAISWLQDNAHNYVVQEEVEEQSKVIVDESLVRFWIYSHHIYSKSKRREILDLANHLKITGFCMPGKPGIICVEGRGSDCNEWWQTIKSMNWKRIFCKVSEECNENDKSNFRKFRTFDEMVFQNCNVKCNHMDMGELFKYLEDHQCGYIFKEIFGVEATKSNV